MTREEFAAYYFDHHAALARRLVPASVGLTHYVQNHALILGSPTSEAPFDCVAELGFPDREALERWQVWYAGPEGRILREDEEHFMDRAARVVLVTEERVPPRGPV